MGSALMFFLLFWVITIATIWTFFEDYYKDDDQDGI
jgi:hypothetical protein